MTIEILSPMLQNFQFFVDNGYQFAITDVVFTKFPNKKKKLIVEFTLNRISYYF